MASFVVPHVCNSNPTSPSPTIYLSPKKGKEKRGPPPGGGGGGAGYISQLICIILLTKNANVILAGERNIYRKIHKDHEASPPIQMNVPLVASNKLCSSFCALI